MTVAVDLIYIPELPTPKGHYAHGAFHGGILHVSGQLPVDAEGRGAEAPFAEQAEKAIDALLAVVAAAGGTAANLVKVTVYLVGVAHWPEFNAIYARIMGEARPARAIVPVPELHHGVLVEIEGIAAIGEQGA